MMENEDAEEAVDNLGSACEVAVVRGEIVIVTVNVDGLGSYATSSSSGSRGHVRGGASNTGDLESIPQDTYR